MKVSVTGLALASLCGSALAAPVNVNADGSVADVADATAKVNAAARDIIGNAISGEGVNGLTNVDGLKQELTGVLGKAGAGGVLARDGEQVTVLINSDEVLGTDGKATLDIRTVVDSLTSGGQVTDAEKLATLKQLSAQVQQLVQQLEKPAGGIAGRDAAAKVDAVAGQTLDAHATADNTRDTTANVDAVVGNLADANADTNANTNANADAALGARDKSDFLGQADVNLAGDKTGHRASDDADAIVNLNGRPVVPEGTVANTVASTDAAVKSAAGVDVLDTVDSLNSNEKELFAQTKGPVSGLAVRDVVSDAESVVTSATGTGVTGTGVPSVVDEELVKSVSSMLLGSEPPFEQAAEIVKKPDTALTRKGDILGSVDKTVESATGLDLGIKSSTATSAGGVGGGMQQAEDIGFDTEFDNGHSNSGVAA
ncbi:hypothetical protein PWT90_09204 [Aphanocladium album]|nr:hypothetical protein PWT90_09204 [Aphanocladium album]